MFSITNMQCNCGHKWKHAQSLLLRHIDNCPKCNPARNQNQINLLNLFCSKYCGENRKHSPRGADKALMLMLSEYVDVLPDINDTFHKTFRAYGVTDSDVVDNAIWVLLEDADVFWECFAEIQRDIELQQKRG